MPPSPAIPRRVLPFLSLTLLLLFFLSLNIPFTQKPASENDSFSLFLSLGFEANASVAENLRQLTSGPHLAGTPPSLAAAAFVLDHFKNSGLRTHSREYSVLLSYPLSSSLSIMARGSVRRLDLTEPAPAPAVKPYHAYSPSRSTAAPPVYVNYGRPQDYDELARMGVEVEGCVVMVRRGGGYRGAAVRRAAERGAVAVIVFDGRGSEGVERGTVLLGGAGDPLTPGWAAVDGAERLGMDDRDVGRRFPAVASLPVPAGAAAEVLGELGGPMAPEEWRRGLGPGVVLAGVGGVGGSGILLNFSYQGENKMGMIKNVIGEIRGEEEPDRYVVLGNHRDAWTFGAVDPNSGTAALLEVARRLGHLLRRGWRPRRTILLCSWDAEEFGMMGSTEWVEENLQLLRLKAVAYLNVDCAVQGPSFFPSATPQLDALLSDVTRKVKDPDTDGKTVYETWTELSRRPQVERLGRADSDFTAFLHLAGVPSLDMYFGEEFAGYHTAFDNYEWMKMHGDPLFRRHVAMAEIWGLMALHLADEPVIPFDYRAYSANLQEHSAAILSWLSDTLSMQPVNTSIQELMAAATEAEEEAKRLREGEREDAVWELRRRGFNDRLMMAERGFLAEEGLRGRPWFKHLVYSPPAEEPESSGGGPPPFFPGIADAAVRAKGDHTKEEDEEEEPWAAVQHEVWRASRAVSRAAAMLRPNLL